MFSYKLVCGFRAPLVTTIITRNKGTAPGSKGAATDPGSKGAATDPGSKRAATDPVQQLFLDKIREYRTKSPNDDLVEPTPGVLKELQKELAKLSKNYGGGEGVDMTAFPTFQFKEAKLDSIDEAVPEKEGKKKKKKKKKPDPKKK